jgi:hypothetical protein
MIILISMAQPGTHSVLSVSAYLFGIILETTIQIVSMKESNRMSAINANQRLLTIIDF